MHTDQSTQPLRPQVEDFRRLETAILTILAYYHGAYEESLQDWYKALKLVAPRLGAPEELTGVFRDLLKSGVIQLRKSGAGPYTGRDDAAFFHSSAFTTLLTPHGLH